MLFLGKVSRNEIFDIDGYRKMSVTGLKVGKFRVPGFWLLNSKLETNQPTAKTFCRRGTLHGEEGAEES